MSHYLTSVQFGPHGELLVAGTMGAMLSMDSGRRWTSPLASAAGSSMAYPVGDAIERLSESRGLDWAKDSMSRVAIDRQGRRYACAKNRMGVEISDDDGRSWMSTQPLDKSDPGTQTVADGVATIVDINGRRRPLRNTAELRAAGDRDECTGVTLIGDVPYVLARAGVYHSEDRGLHWIGHYHFLGGFTGYYPRGAGGLFGDGNGTLYVNHERAWQGGDGHLRVYRSMDQGETWQAMTFNFAASDLAGDMMLLRIRDDVLYFAMRSGDSGHVSLCRSVDGRTATRLLDFDRGDFPRAGVNFMDIGPRGELAVLGPQNLFLSEDQGRSWRLIDREALMKTSWIRSES